VFLYLQMFFLWFVSFFAKLRVRLALFEDRISPMKRECGVWHFCDLFVFHLVKVAETP